MTDTDRVWNALHDRRFRYRNEIALHEGLSGALTAAGIEHQREVQVRGGRIDFVVGSLGVEVKVAGTTDAVREQLQRYASDDRFTELLLVTTRPAHRALTGEIGGKPVQVLTIGGLAL